MPGISSAAIMAKPNTVAETLSGAVLWLDARDSVDGEQAVVNKGVGGAVLNAQYGSTTSIDVNDPLFLPHTGTNYLYTSSTAGNSATVPDSPGVSVTGPLEVAVRMSMVSWTAAGYASVIGKRGASLEWEIIKTNTAGDPKFALYRSADGTTWAVSGNPSDATFPFVDGVTYWLKVTHIPSTGALRFFYAADQTAEPTSWTQVGSTITTPISVPFDGASTINLGAGGFPSNNMYKRVIVRNGINGPVVLDIDFTTNTQQSSLVCSTGQTVTINRSSTGRKSVMVVRPTWLFGADDYMEIADNGLLDIGSTDSLTALIVCRQILEASADRALIAKRAGITGSATLNGYSFGARTTGLQGYAADGTNQDTLVSAVPLSAYSNQIVTLGMMRPSGKGVNLTINGNIAASSVSQVSEDLSNSLPLRVGRTSATGTAYADMECYAVLVWRRALSVSELAAISAYFNA